MNNTILDDLDKTVASYPDKIAFEDSNNKVTFLELGRMSMRIGTFVAKVQASRKPALIIMEKGANNIPAFLGTVYAGGFYVPIDFQMPKERIKLILDTLNPEFILYDQKSSFLIRDLSLEEISYSFDEAVKCEIDEELLYSRRIRMRSTDLLYVLFTSGSTGRPKGVTISHSAVMDFTRWITEKYGLSANVKMCNQAPFYFDASVPDIFIPIKTGATALIPPKSYYTFPKQILQYIRDNEINTLVWVPSALCNVVNARAFEVLIPDSIKLVIFCGEVMPCKHLNVWRKYIPNAKYVNMYGPTEATYACTYYDVEDTFADDDKLPLGVPCENSDILLIKENGEEAERGEIGEICILGECLSNGYYNAWERTKEAFAQNPINNRWLEKIYKTGDLAYKNDEGVLIFAGRKDFQIKKLGHRIELGEIENAILSIEGVKNACCLYNEASEEIIAVIAGNLVEKEMEVFLLNKISRYMIPDKYVILENMPMNINGKIDRIKLKNLYAGG